MCSGAAGAISFAGAATEICDCTGDRSGAAIPTSSLAQPDTSRTKVRIAADNQQVLRGGIGGVAATQVERSTRSGHDDHADARENGRGVGGAVGAARGLVGGVAEGQIDRRQITGNTDDAVVVGGEVVRDGERSVLVLGLRIF